MSRNTPCAEDARPALALYQPDIPQNAGACLRTAACLGAALHLIHPAGFSLDDRKLRRAGLDYTDRAVMVQHDDWAAFEVWRRTKARRLVALSARGDSSLAAFSFRPGDLLLLGRESAGLPGTVLAGADARVAIPIRPETRSLNMANAAAIALFEALRQMDALPSR